ncbi:M1 family aminopeptidase [Pseudoalteromonas agarivorans]|uniref:M1 family aminopeptidase n=1 Tax=Pseudoalteromonas agarivorans TaxID=176102 RepID=UPI00040EBEAD|nr:M1 family aminopeptidase [Pseudoalteromonas agarivorans]
MLIFNEWRYAVRQPLVWLCIIIPLIFAIMLSYGLATVEVDSLKQFKLNITMLQMMQLPMLVGVLAPVMLLRDQHASMQELIYVTQTSLFKRSLARVCILICLVFIISLSAILIMAFMHIRQLGYIPNTASFTLFSSFLVLLPNSCLLVVIAFYICHKSATSLPNYVFFAVLWVGYIVLASITGNPMLAGSSIISNSFYTLFIWLDPFAYTGVINSLTNSLGASFAINRVVVSLLAVGIFLITLNQNTILKNKKANKGQSTNEYIRHNMLEPAEYTTARVTQKPFLMMASLYKITLVNLVSHPVTLLIIFVWPVMVFNSVASSSGYVEPMSVMSTTSLDAISYYAFDMQLLIGTLLLALWSWQVSCFAKYYNIAELIAATPLKTYYFIISQLFVLGTMILVFLSMSLLGASAAQWFLHSAYQLEAHLSILFLMFIPLTIIACVFLCVFNLCRSQLIAGLLIGAILLIKFTPIMTYFGLTHTLWSVGWTPLQAPDNFWGYRASMSSYWPYISVWLVACISLVIITGVFNHRGTGLSRRVLGVKHFWLFIPLLITVALFTQLHLRLVEEKPLTNSHKREAFKAQYEKSFSQWRNVAQPRIVHIDANVDFYPQKQQAHFSLIYTLKNTHQESIKEVLIGRAGFYKWANIEIDGAQRAKSFPLLNQAVFKLENEMQPGEIRKLVTRFDFHQAKLWPVRGHQIITPEFSYIRSVPLLPTVGYQDNYELTDPILRQQHALKVKQSIRPTKLFAKTAKASTHYQWLTMSSKVSTTSGYQVITQGEEISRTSKDDREIFHFETRTPINAIPAWVTVPYSPVTKQQNGVMLNVFAKDKNEPARADSIAVNLSAMGDTIKWLNKISPYRAKQLSLIGSPRLGVTGYALPQLILIEDSVGFRSKPSANAGFDQRYRRAVHETAHQWFGHDIGNGVFADSAFLVESLAKYIELVVIEQRYGKKAMQALVEYETSRYQQSALMSIKEKLALVDATQGFDQYSRSTIVFAKLRAVIGDKPIIRALRSIWKNNSYPNRPANSMDFIRSLKFEAGIEHEALINKLLLE